MSEAKGPYTTGDSVGLVFKDGRGVENFDSERDKLNACRLANIAHAEGFKAGRASRDAVIEAAKDVVSAVDGWKARLAIEELEKALSEDGKWK